MEQLSKELLEDLIATLKVELGQANMFLETFENELEDLRWELIGASQKLDSMVRMHDALLSIQNGLVEHRGMYDYCDGVIKVTEVEIGVLRIEESGWRSRVSAIMDGADFKEAVAHRNKIREALSAAVCIQIEMERKRRREF